MFAKSRYYLEMMGRVRWLNVAPKALNYFSYKLRKKSKILDISKYTPQIASLIITKRCNMTCSFCSAGTIMNDAKGAWKENELTLEKVKEIFSNKLFKNSLLVDLLGGEPLLVRELDDIVAYLSEQGYLTNTSTNGVLLRRRIGNLKRAGITRINVSYYHENKQLLEKDLPEVNKIFPVHMSFVLMATELRNNAKEIYNVVDFAKRSGCKSLRFFLYRPMGLDPNANDVFYAGDKDYEEFKSEIEKRYPNFVLWPSLEEIDPNNKRCAQLWQRVGCTATGEMLICCGVEDFLQGSDANLFKSSPQKVINHPTLVELRDGLLDPQLPPPDMCKSCNLLNESGW